MRPVDKKPIKAPVFLEYDGARRLLVEALGGYCSYCESPISVDIPVEHKAAKSVREGKKYKIAGVQFSGEEKGFPAEQDEWRNLLLACAACNSAKGARPNREDAREYLYQAGRDFRSTKEEILYLGAIDSSVWPDDTPAVRKGKHTQPALPGDQTYQLFSYVRKDLSQVDLANHGYLRVLSSSDQQQPWAITRYDRIWVLPNEGYIRDQMNPELLLNRVKKALQILQLNRYHEGDPRASDRRTENRTVCYQMATSALADLAVLAARAGVFNEGKLIPKALLLVQAIREAALAMGFWSVWMTVFVSALGSNVPPWDKLSPEQKGALVSALFLKYLPGERAPGSNLLIFPGTDLSRVQL